MDSCAGQRGIIVVVFLTLKLGLWHCDEAAASFPAAQLEVHGDLQHQRLLVKWSVSKKPYKSDTDITFHIQVARSEKMNIIENKTYKSNFSRSPLTFKWSWDSALPLECDSHSVRIRSKAVENVPTAEMNWSEWSPWKTHQGQNKGRKEAKVYPHEESVPLGSNVTFCCLPGPGQTVRKMTYDLIPVERSRDMGTDAFVISVKNVTKSKSDGANIECEGDEILSWSPLGTVLYVTRLPDEPESFSCETQDLRTLRCRWNPGDSYNFYGHLKVSYVLHERLSQKPRFCKRDHCDWPIQMDQEMYNFTLTAKNILGERSINSIVYLAQSVLLLAPSSLTVSDVTSSTITLLWSLKANYASLQIHCQVDPQKNPGSEVNMTTRGKWSLEIYRVTLRKLQPYTHYDLRVRCMANSSLAGWSSWSHILVRTTEDAPAGSLDIWRKIKDDHGERAVTLIWKPSSSFRANGDLSHYSIKFRPLGGVHVEREINVSGTNSSQILIGQQAYSINVSAHNKVGGSLPAELRIPAKAASGDAEQVIAEKADGKDGGIYLTWPLTPGAGGYVVEWCPVPRSLQCDDQWKKYDAGIQSDIIRSELFTPGVKYEFRIYGSMNDGEHLLKKAFGYTDERVCSKKPNVTISNITPWSVHLDWTPSPDESCPNRIADEYFIYVKITEESCSLFIDEANRITQVDPYYCRYYVQGREATQFTLRGLQPMGTYKVAVVAITKGGQTPKDFFEVHTPADTTPLFLSILVPIIVVPVLALALLFIGCWKRTWLKRMCLPDIPDPNKSKIFDVNGVKSSLYRITPPTTNHEPQMVDFVSIQAKGQHKTDEDVNDSSEYQLQATYTNIQTGECHIIEGYVPCDEKSLYPPADPAYKLQSLPCMAFLNQTYTGTVGNISNGAPGYKPQTNIALVHCLPYHVQSVDPESGLHDGTSICFNSPGYDSEPMSPTSVDSTSFILVD